MYSLLLFKCSEYFQLIPRYRTHRNHKSTNDTTGMSSNFCSIQIQFYFWLMKIHISNHPDSQLSRPFNPVPISLGSPGSTVT